MKFFLKVIYRRFLLLVPQNRTGDKFIAHIDFVRFHRRLPNKGRLNDRLFKIKVSDEIQDVLRQYTSDKEFVKDYVSKVVGDQFNVPTKAILKNRAEILSYNFENGDVVKPTQASGLVLFIDNSIVDRDEMVKWLNVNYYHISREANYRYLQPKIIIEERLFGSESVDDIKFFCVNGKVKVVQWDFDRRTNHTRALYDNNWNNLNASLGYPLSTKSRTKPKKLHEMISVAEQLAKPFSLVRVDLYYDDETEKFVVGEITHCHGSSNERFSSLDAEIRVANVLFG